MKDILNKFVSLEKELSQEKGNFSLFALFLREDSEDKWDLVLSASWLNSSDRKAYKNIADYVNTILDKEELIFLSRIVLLDKTNPVVEAVNHAISIEHGQCELKDCNFFGLQIKHAYIITSKRENGIPQAKSA
jgi:hypothetical protein